MSFFDRSLPQPRLLPASVVTEYAVSATLLATDCVAVVDATAGAVTITLPLAGSCKGRRYFVVKKDAGANAVTVSRAGADTLNYAGGTTASLAAQDDRASFISDGKTTWIREI